MQVKLGMNGEKRELHAGIFGPFLPCSLPPGEEVLLFQQSPKCLASTCVGPPLVCSPRLSPASLSQNSTKAIIPTGRHPVMWEVQGSRALLTGLLLIHELPLLPSFFPGGSQCGNQEVRSTRNLWYHAWDRLWMYWLISVLWGQETSRQSGPCPVLSP